jgi:hypothetical protein
MQKAREQSRAFCICATERILVIASETIRSPTRHWIASSLGCSRAVYTSPATVLTSDPALYSFEAGAFCVTT